MVKRLQNTKVNMHDASVHENYVMKPSLSLVSFLWILMLAIGCADHCSAQTTETGLGTAPSGTAAASYYYIARPGELTKQINLWGFVRNPGRYEVPSSTDLIQLISYAGGPLPEASIDDVKITRFVRNGNDLTKREVSVDLEKLDGIDQANTILYSGDTIYVDHTSWSTIRDAFTVISTGAIVVGVITQIMILNNR